MKRPIVLLVILTLFCAAEKSQAAFIVGGPGDPFTGNSYPFGDSSIVAYQQVYAASNFSGPMNISGLTFYNNNYIAGTINTATYTVQLSTTSAAVNGLSNTFASNLGANNQTVFSGTLSGTANPSFTINTSLFNYNPTGGNLLLTVFKSSAVSSSGSVYNDARNGAGGLFSRKYSSSSTTTADNEGGGGGIGLVTGFESAPANAVPAPAGLLLAMTGLPLLVGMMRRRTTPAIAS